MFPDINIVNRYISDGGIIDSRLGIQSIHHNQSGQFSCKLSSSKMNVSKSLNVFVISKETKYCKANVTKGLLRMLGKSHQLLKNNILFSR